MLRSAWALGCAAILFGAAGCAVHGTQYAAYDPAFVRYQLSTLEYPTSVDDWYACFALPGALERQRCLVATSGVRRDEGHGHTCPDPPDPTLLCRAFGLGPPEPSPDAYTEEGAGDATASAIAEGFFRVLFAVFEAALSADASDDRDENDEPEESARKRKRNQQRDGGRSYRRAEPTRRK